jgi:hypothetical protein
VKDLERILTSDARRVRGEFEETQRHKLAALHRKAERKIRRRRLVRRGGGLVALATAGVLVSVFPSAETGGPVVRAGTVLAAGGSVAQDPFSQFGLWPYVSRDLSEHVCSSSRLRGSEDAATNFASSMFGWSRPIVVGENDYGDHITSTVAELPPGVSTGPVPPVPVVKLHLERLRSQDCWWVTGVSDSDSGARFKASVEEGDLYVSFDLLPGAERADVVVVEGSNNLRRFLHTDAGDTRARASGFRGPAAVLVLWKNADGVVFSAAGVTLPAGDSSHVPL